MESETISFIQNFAFFQAQNCREEDLRDFIVSRINVDSLRFLDTIALKSDSKLNILRMLIMILSNIMQTKDSNEFQQVDMTVITQQHIIRIAQLEVMPAIQLTLINMNNLAVYFFINSQHALSKQILKFLRKNFTQRNQHLEFMVTINLARLQYSMQNYQKSYTLSEKALFTIEAHVFGVIKHDPNCLMQNPGDVILLLNGYLLFAKSLEKLGPHQQLNPIKFYQNGFKLARKYLGQQHSLTKRFMYYERQSFHYQQKAILVVNSSSNSIQADKICLLLLRTLKKELVPLQNPPLSSSDSIQRINQDQDETKRFKIRQLSRTNMQGNPPQATLTLSLQDQVGQQHFVKHHTARILKQEAVSNITEFQSVSKKHSISGDTNGNRVSSARRIVNEQNGSQQPFEIESLIQKKFEELISRQTKQQEDLKKSSEMELQVKMLKNENTNLQMQKQKNDKQIDELKQLLSNLSEESRQIKEKLRDYEIVQEALKKKQQQYQQWQDQHSNQMELRNSAPSSLHQNQSSTQIPLQSKPHKLVEQSSIRDNEQSSNGNQMQFLQQIPSTPVNQANNSVQKRLTKLTQNGGAEITLQPKKSPTNSNIVAESSPKLPPKQETNKSKSKYVSAISPDNLQYLQQSTSNDINAIISTLSQQQQRSPKQGKELSILQQQNKEVSKEGSNTISNFSDSILTFDPLIFTFMDGQENQYPIVLMQDTIIQKRVQIDGIMYDIQCSVVRNRDVQLKLRAVQVDSTELSPNPEREKDNYVYLDLPMLRDIIPMIDFKLLLPAQIPLKSISDYKTFIQYLVVPFVGVSHRDNETKIEMWPSAPGLLLESTRVWFFEEECHLILHYLQGRDFRLIFVSQRNESHVFKLDLSFDQSSLELFFDQVGQDDMAIEDVQDMMKLLDFYDDANFDDQSRQNVVEIVERRRQRNRTFLLPSYLVKDFNRFVQFCEKIKSDIQQLLQRHYKISKMADLKTLIDGKSFRVPFKADSTAKLKVISIKVWEKAMCQRVAFVADNTKEKQYEIHLANLFESHAPQMQKIKAEGSISISYEQIIEKIGQNDDKVVNEQLLLEMYKLDIFEKELEPDDYDRFRSNMMMEVGIISEMNIRLYHVIDGYRVPVTICYLGINDVPVGLKIQLHNAHALKSQGVFLLLNSLESWRKPDKVEVVTGKKKRARKYMQERQSTSKYQLPQLLSRVGFQLIFEKVKLENGELSRHLPNKSISRVDRMDNIVNFSTVLECLNQ